MTVSRFVQTFAEEREKTFKINLQQNMQCKQGCSKDFQFILLKGATLR